MLVVLAVLCLQGRPAEAAQKPSALFIHHSVGASLIRDGRLRQILSEAGVDFWDHGYNDPNVGLRDQTGAPAGNYGIPNDNTTPYGYARMFTMDPNGDNAWRRILDGHDIILFKSCFPVSNIRQDDPEKDRQNPGRRSLSNYKRHYRTIREATDRHPDKRFVIITPPPLHPDATDPVAAQRARAFADWLSSTDFLEDRKHLFVFDLFDLLADPQTNTLRTEFHLDPNSRNSHPNPVAHLTVAPRLADFVINIIKKGSGANAPTGPAPVVSPMLRSNRPHVRLHPQISGNRENIKRITWTDLNGNKGLVDASGQVRFDYGPLPQGVTILVFTVFDRDGFQNSASIAVRYHTLEQRQAVILDESGHRGKIRGTSDEEKRKVRENGGLYLNGSGSRRRIVIDDIGLDISSFDPEGSSMKLTFGKGVSRAPLRLIVPGILSTELHPVRATGEQDMSVELGVTTYLVNSLNRIILKGNWPQNESVYIRSIRLVQK